MFEVLDVEVRRLFAGFLGVPESSLPKQNEEMEAARGLTPTQLVAHLAAILPTDLSNQYHLPGFTVFPNEAATQGIRRELLQDAEEAAGGLNTDAAQGNKQKAKDDSVSGWKRDKGFMAGYGSRATQLRAWPRRRPPRP